MQIILNGSTYNLEQRITLHDLLIQLTCSLNGTAIAVNQNIIPRAKYVETWLENNDKVEIVTAFQGG